MCVSRGRSKVSKPVGGGRHSPMRMSSDRRGDGRKVSLPKGGLGSVEVIQPQIPLRLPCYDLSPLAKPRFDVRGTPHPDLTRVL